MAEGHPGKLIVRPIPISSEAISRAIARRFGCAIEPLTAPPKKPKLETVFALLTPVEREFVAKFLIVDVSQLNEAEFEKFMNMSSGAREFRMALQVTECWKSDWKVAIPEARECIRSISEKCGFVPVTKEEMLIAVATGMSQTQRSLLNQFFMCPMHPYAPVTSVYSVDSSSDELAAKLEVFDAWLRIDNKLLTQHWNTIYPPVDTMRSLGRKLAQGLELSDAEMQTLAWVKQVVGTDSTDKSELINAFNHVNKTLHALRNLWFNTPQNERFAYWKHNTLDLHTAAGLAHKVRFVADHSLSREEKGLAVTLINATYTDSCYDRNSSGLGLSLSNQYSPNGVVRLPDDNLANLRDAFTKATSDNKYKQPIVHLAAFDGQMRSESLLTAAYVQAQFDVFISALGFDTQSPQTKITYDHSDMKAKRDKTGNPQKCEDNFSSAEVHLPDGSVINLHAVFDGIGGHQGGEVASGIAKEVFEISAMAGWITTPEDVRRTIITADLAITMEQILRKTSSDLYVHKAMGSTMSVAFQHNDQFYGIHCGDSDWKVIRNGAVVFRDIGHSLAYEYGYESALRELSGRDPSSLTPEETRQFFRRVKEETEKYESSEFVIAHRNVIVSAVGGIANYITINNMDSDALPFILKDGDHIILNSDGIGVPVCDHEFALFLDLYHGDLKQVREALISTAEARRTDNRNGPPDADGHPTAITEFDTTCSCPPRLGKGDDDKVVTIAKVKLPA